MQNFCFIFAQYSKMSDRILSGPKNIDFSLDYKPLYFKYYIFHSFFSLLAKTLLHLLLLFCSCSAVAGDFYLSLEDTFSDV